MTKKIILSLAMIALTIAGVTSATVAYFSDTAVKSDNTFAMGTVDLDEAWTNGFPFHFVNLTPGEESTSGILGVGYGGSILADLYFGMRDDNTSDATNLTPILDYYIEEVTSGGTHIRNVFGWRVASDAFANWNKIADNLTNGDWSYYKVHIRVHSNAQNSYQGEFAGNDVIIYAVQDGQTPPASPPPWDWSPTP